MCKCCQHCLETCYWHLIEKHFCFDESIALYEEPAEKDEKNNNMFDNIAFYDSVSVIAGRAVVTIDPLPEKQQSPIVQQPKFSERRKWWQDEIISKGPDLLKTKTSFISRSAPIITEEVIVESQEESHENLKETSTEKSVTITINEITTEETRDTIQELQETNQSPSEGRESTSSDTTDAGIQFRPKTNTLDPTDNQNRKKSLRERRMSKSLYLKIEKAKDMPIIRQQSMPKFYLDTPDEHQNETALIRVPSTALASPVPNQQFIFDLYSVVQLEREKSLSNLQQVQVHGNERGPKRLSHIKEKIKLRRVKSTLSASNSMNQINYI